MLDLFKKFAVNTDAEEDGVEVEIGKNTFITVARAGNTHYNRLLSKLFEAHKFELDQKGPDAEYRSEQIMIEVASKALLKGWRTVDDTNPDAPVSKSEIMFDGVVLPFSVANAATALAVKDFRSLVQKHSENFQLFRLVAEESDVKK